MYITSKFHDFYDKAIGLGIDKTVVYVRNTEKLPSPSKAKEASLYELCDKMPSSYSVGTSRGGYSIEGCLLIICGEVIPFIKYRDTQNNTHYFYQHDKLNDFLSANGRTLERYYSSFWRERHSVYSNEGAKKFLATKDFARLSELLHKHKVPVIEVSRSSSVRDVHIVANPCLKEIAYQTQKDPFTTFQNIFMFISGVLGVNQTPMIKVSDKILAAKRGHDGPYSFKNVPGKKRGRS